MGVYIPNMEKPKDCKECQWHLDFYIEDEQVGGLCTITEKDDRENDCPLIEIDEPKAGRWIPYKAYFGKKKDSWTDELKCSECGYEWGDEDYNFCPNCGAKMERRADEKL